jgi:hypothetical protein
MSEPPPGATSPDDFVPPPPEDLPPVPDDAGDTRDYHFRRLLGKPLTWILGGAVALIAFVAIAAAGYVAIGGAVAAGILLVTVLIVYLLARGKAEADFFRAYSEGRDLRWASGRGGLPPVTPLLRRGDDRYTQQSLQGVLPGGMDGTLALYTYEEETRDSDGNKQTSYFHFTVAMTNLPESAPLVRELFCQRRFGFKFLDSAEDVFRKRQRVEQESAAVDERYEIFIGQDDDMNVARQILSPTFLVWLADHSPEKFAFELVAGALVCNVKGHQKSAAELDVLCTAASAVARRVHEEAAEIPTR